MAAKTNKTFGELVVGDTLFIYDKVTDKIEEAIITDVLVAELVVAKFLYFEGVKGIEMVKVYNRRFSEKFILVYDAMGETILAFATSMDEMDGYIEMTSREQPMKNIKEKYGC